ncbi:mannonate dehydratase [Alkalicoccus urumqiensis]|uniref:Mannonate dehydratase n=1 Tax=Alkalicoccus urumqiensis TaxID=1548213 RepID=A0A2P6MJN3_ALKUR|nr:mannonate dehydratase [Alkalicoccus urumqiensis]PRO66496.1 mannonate dehydratase [Alkalicoccus urumqiensis]
MEMSFRWYGDDDPVTLENIRQIPDMKGIVSAIYDIPAGGVWPYDRIMQLKEKVEQHGMRLNVIESVPVHEDIKMGKPARETWIENYKQTIRNLSKAGIKTICYNFMPVFDWTRSEMAAALPDGSNSLKYDEDTLKDIDPLSGQLTLPGWDLSYQTDELQAIMDGYKEIDEDQLMDNLVYFLERIIPVAEEEDVLMAIHPDDPPWRIFDLPRVINGNTRIKEMLTRVDSPSNGITFCTGSYGADPENDLLEIIETAEGRIHFVHARNVKRMKSGYSFQETAHSIHAGSIDMVAVLEKLHEVGFDGPIRPDHGRMIWGETGRPGYGLYDRALGATYLNGIIHTLQKKENAQ